MIPGKTGHSLFITISYLFLSLLWVQDIWGSSFPLDEEAVFCLYYKMSGKNLDLQDIEDLCYQLGRPAYTSFKPSEMFMKRNIREVRKRMEEKIERIQEDSLFIWRFRASLIPSDSKPGHFRVIYHTKEMPQATPYIFSEISRKGQIVLRKRLGEYIHESSNHVEPAELEIVVSLRPEKVAYRYQKRNIALEDVVLPIRYVIFHPVNVRTLDKRLTILEGEH